MGAMHFLMKTLPRVASEMALPVLAYNMRVEADISTRPRPACLVAFVRDIGGLGSLLCNLAAEPHFADHKSLL